MYLKLLSLVSLVLLTTSCFSQVGSKKEANKVLAWVIENPQIATDSIFKEKLVDILKWQALSHPHIEMRVTGISEFMNTSQNYKFFQEITMIYMLSENMNQINGESKELQSAFLALNNVLSFYKNLIELNSGYENPILEKYAEFSEKELRNEIKRLKK